MAFKKKHNVHDLELENWNKKFVKKFVIAQKKKKKF